MDRGDELLAAFLREGGRVGAAGAYIGWLDGRGDVRGEYLRLLIGLGEPEGPDDDGAERGRLRELRGRVDAGWADAVDRTRLRWDGLYQKDEPRGGAAYLRFYADGVVLEAGTNTRVAADVWGWFTRAEREDGGGPYRGRWTLCGDRLAFSISSMRPMDPEVMNARWSGDEEGWRELCEEHNAECAAKGVEYAGVLGRETIAVRWRSRLNGAEGVDVYRFEKVAEGRGRGGG